MLSLDTLRAFGADVDDGLKRCLNNEAFYLMMIRKALPGISLSELKSALDGGDLTKAFELCHAMKGGQSVPDTAPEPCQRNDGAAPFPYGLRLRALCCPIGGAVYPPERFVRGLTLNP